MKNRKLSKFLSVFLAVTIIFGSAPLSGFVGIELPEFNFSIDGEALTEGYYRYEVLDGKATITGRSFQINGDVIIPSTLGGYPVTAIGKGVFWNEDGLTSVEIPDSVTVIDNQAFSACYNLTMVTIGNGVKTIYGGTFSSCERLTTVTIGNNVTCIERQAFDCCKSLTDVYYNGTQEEWNEVMIGEENEDLVNAKFHFETPIKYFEYEISNNMVTITDYKGTDTEVIIPSKIEGYTVTELGDYAFCDEDSVVSVVIPDCVIRLGQYVFGNCTSLASIKIPDNVTYIGDSAFYSCKNLSSITIPDSITNIGRDLFGFCVSLSSVKISKNVTSIGDYAFSGCDSLLSIEIPDSVINIGCSAFVNCKNLISIEIPDSVVEIGDDAFGGCGSLKSIEIPNSVTSIGDGAFYSCESLISINLSNCLERIGEDVFSWCKSLTTIKIPDNVTRIDHNAFRGCEKLISIEFSKKVKCIGEDTFMYCSKLTDVYYSGTEKEWKEIDFCSGNTYLMNATIHFAEEPCEHEYVMNVTAPTCTKKGFITYVCSLCYESYVGDFVDATGHTPDIAVEENCVESTCTEDGSYDAVVYCTVCQAELSRETKSLSATGHMYGAWEVTTEPTMTEKGEKFRTCSECGVTEAGEVPATGITVTVTDAEGKVVTEKIIEGDLTGISFDDLEDGEYTVTVRKETFTKRTYTVSATDGEASLDFSLNKTGDMNGDGKVNAVDVARANAHAKGVSSLSGYALDCVDVNGDGKVNAIDVALLNAHSKGVKSLW